MKGNVVLRKPSWKEQLETWRIALCGWMIMLGLGAMVVSFVVGPQIMVWVGVAIFFGAAIYPGAMSDGD